MGYKPSEININVWYKDIREQQKAAPNPFKTRQIIPYNQRHAIEKDKKYIRKLLITDAFVMRPFRLLNEV